MDMTIQEEIEQLVLRCIAADGLKACPKDISFLEKYRLKNLKQFGIYEIEEPEQLSQNGHYLSVEFAGIHKENEFYL